MKTTNRLVEPAGINDGVARDGTIVDLVADPIKRCRPRLVVWRGGRAQICSHVHLKGELWSAPRLSPIIQAIRLPAYVAPVERCGDLFRDTKLLLRSRLAQTEAVITILTVYIFYTWFAYSLPVALTLMIVLPPIGSCDALLQLLGALCRRPLCVAGARPADFKAFPMWIRPTVLLNEPEMGRRMIKLLQTTTQRDAYVAFGNKLYDLWSPKIICTRRPPDDSLLMSNMIRLALIPENGTSGRLDDTIPEEFQARFLGYRLRNMMSVRWPDFGGNGINESSQYLGKILGAAILDDHIKEQILPIISAQDEEARAERSRSVEAVLVEALIFFCKDKHRLPLRCSEIAETTNDILSGRGESERVSPEKVGWMLRRLGLHTRRLGSAGNGIELNELTRTSIQQLAMAYEVRTCKVQAQNKCPNSLSGGV